MSLPSIPRLPTDNLYKFVALAGTILLIVGWVAPAITIERAEERVRLDRRDLELLELQTGADKLGMELLAIQERTDTSARFIRRLDSLRLRTDSTRRETIHLSSQIDASKAFLRLARVYALIGGILSTAGILAMAWGFWNWYYKLQKPLDEWVKRHGGPPDAPE